MESQNFDYPITDRAHSKTQQFLAQSQVSKGSYLQRSNAGNLPRAYQRILSRSKGKQKFSKQFQIKYIKNQKSFSVRMPQVMRLAAALSVIVKRRTAAGFQKIKNDEESNSFSFDIERKESRTTSRNTNSSRIQEKLGYRKDRMEVKQSRLELQQFLCARRARGFIRRLRENYVRALRQHRAQKKKHILTQSGNFSSTPLRNTDKNQNEVKETLKSSRNAINLEFKSFIKKRPQLTTERSRAQFQSELLNQSLPISYYYTKSQGNFNKQTTTSTPYEALTPRSRMGSIWNDSVLQHLTPKTQQTKNLHEVQVHHVIQPVIHHIYQPINYYPTPRYEMVHQTRFEPMLLPRYPVSSGFGSSISGVRSQEAFKKTPTGSVFPPSPMNRKVSYH